MRGRPRKPTVLKLIEGDRGRGRRPLNNAEPEPASGCLKPKFLKGRAAKVWDDYASELERIGVLTAVDGQCSPRGACWRKRWNAMLTA